MRQFIKKLPVYQVLRGVAILSLVFFVMFNGVIIYDKFGNYANKLDLFITATRESVFVYIFIYALFLGLYIDHRLLYISTIILFFFSAIASYNIYFFASYPSVASIKHSLDSGISDSLAHIHIKMVLWLIFSTFVAWYAVYTYNAKANNFFIRLLMALCLFASLYHIVDPEYHIINHYLPFRLVNSFCLYLGG